MPRTEVTRKQVVHEAKRWLGVPWKHQGRSRRGVDCVGLVYCVALDLGLVEEGEVRIPRYGPQPDGTLLSYFEQHMVRRPVSHLAPGAVMIFSFARSPYHAGILTSVNPSSLIHAYARRRKVVPDMVDSVLWGRVPCALYDFKGVVDG